MNLTGHSHFIASRQGLFSANEHSWELLAPGQFYGITLFGDALYAFETLDLPRLETRRGRILRFNIADKNFSAPEVMASGLDNGCHQIDIFDEHLYVIDTYQQRIIRFSLDFSETNVFYPLPRADAEDWRGGYAHCNSLLAFGNHCFLLLHEGGRKTLRPSRVIACDKNWKPTRQAILPAFGCHNLVLLEEGQWLFCGSLDGSLIDLKRRIVKLDDMMTRGLSVGDDVIAVGASMFATRKERRFVPGRVHFLNRDLSTRAVLEVPAAPTDIRRIDGEDYSLSQYANRRLSQYTSDIDSGTVWQPWSA